MRESNFSTSMWNVDSRAELSIRSPSVEEFFRFARHRNARC